MTFWNISILLYMAFESRAYDLYVTADIIRLHQCIWCIHNVVNYTPQWTALKMHLKFLPSSIVKNWLILSKSLSSGLLLIPITNIKDLSNSHKKFKYNIAMVLFFTTYLNRFRKKYDKNRRKFSNILRGTAKWSIVKLFEEIQTQSGGSINKIF